MEKMAAPFEEPDMGSSTVIRSADTTCDPSHDVLYTRNRSHAVHGHRRVVPLEAVPEATCIQINLGVIGVALGG